MTENDNQRFYKGDVITFRGNKYEVTQVDTHFSHPGVLQYRLDALGDSPPATLEPRTHRERAYTVKEFHEVAGEDVAVVE
jgi:hypothetical protein